MDPLDLADWFELTAIGVAIRESLWLFPVIESFHLLGLSMLGGAVLLVDLRLLGAGLKDRPVAYLLDQTRPWLLAALALMFATGIPLFLSEAVKCYYSDAFWVKMIGLFVAMIFTFAVRNRFAADADAGLQKLLGLASFSLWLTVAAAGRWIGFS